MKKEQRKSPNLTKKEINFLLEAVNAIEDETLKGRIKVRILSRISALGLCGGWVEDKKLTT